MHDPVAYHLLPAEIWNAADPAARLHVASLETDGFVHLTHRMTDLVEVANSLYRDDPRPHVVLTIRLASLTSPWRYEGDERFPHVYGPLDRDAITEVRRIDRDDDGAYLPIERPDPRRNDRDDADSLFDDAIDAAIDRLPPMFAEQLGSVAIVVEDEATPEQLAVVAARGLYGLYQGVPRTRWGVDNVAIPSKITLFRGPLIRANPLPEQLSVAIEDTLFHEIAHHLGIDDARLHELQAERRHG